jgi:hypothetical protein
MSDWLNNKAADIWRSKTDVLISLLVDHVLPDPNGPMTAERALKALETDGGLSSMFCGDRGDFLIALHKLIHDAVMKRHKDTTA